MRRLATRQHRRIHSENVWPNGAVRVRALNRKRTIVTQSGWQGLAPREQGETLSTPQKDLSYILTDNFCGTFPEPVLGPIYFHSEISTVPH